MILSKNIVVTNARVSSNMYAYDSWNIRIESPSSYDNTRRTDEPMGNRFNNKQCDDGRINILLTSLSLRKSAFQKKT